MVLRKTIVSLHLLFLFILSLSGQESLQQFERVVLNIQEELNASEVVQIPNITAPNAPHLSVAIKCRPGDFSSLKMYNEQTQTWVTLELDEHLSYDLWSFGQLLFYESGTKMPLLKSTREVKGAVEVHIFNPGNEHPKASPGTHLRSMECRCAEPQIVERAEWCSDCHLDSTPVANTPEFIIVHHSAGTNSSSNWSAVVRSIWDHHVNTRGWDDIGYNYLIDPEGQIYLGRGDEILGAHFCGTNSGTLGICMMGTYTNVPPTPSALEKLKLLTSWQNCKYEIAPLEQEYHPSSNEILQHISGHRDGCATECPGQMLYDLLPQFRRDVQFVMDTCGDSIVQEPIVLEGVLKSPFTAKLNWSGIPMDAASVLLEYSDERDPEMKTIEIQTKSSIEIILRARRTYTFHIRAKLPTGSEIESNEVELTTPSLTNDQIYVKLFPNPLFDVLNLQLSNAFYGEFSITIAAFQGYPVFEQTYFKDGVMFQKEINLSFLPPGMYLIYVRHEHFRIRSKLIKI